MSMIDLEDITDFVAAAQHWFQAEFRITWLYTQAGILAAAAALAWLISTGIRRRIDVGAKTMGLPGPLRLLARAALNNLGVALFALLVWLVRVVMVASTAPNRSYLLAVVLSLATAWLIIRLVTSLLRDAVAVRLVSVSAWVVAALSILRLLDPTIAALDSFAFKLGGLRITPLLILKVTVMMTVVLWLANIASKFIESRVSTINELTPSVQVLIVKFARLVLTGLAIIIVMSAAGVDLSALTIFSGAVGVGIGFGLQKIVGNFVSGVILLADKSVKPGDLVTIGDSFGRVSAMNTRYISVSAGDGREFLIPNEDLVTQKVVNWTYTDKNTLVEVKFGVDYETDPRRVCQIAQDIAVATPRVTRLKPPVCLVTEFAEYGIRFSLTFWIADPDAGMGNIRSEVMLALWDRFRQEGISMPLPVRDIRVRGVLPLEAYDGPRLAAAPAR
ncbi:MAG: mechanosensitive ion channel [Xanthobacteraceae bacterium]|nr:MAG: mechanosensitive ion channel [Xanthobacteraceae bacterium]